MNLIVRSHAFPYSMRVDRFTLCLSANPADGELVEVRSIGELHALRVTKGLTSGSIRVVHLMPDFPIQADSHLALNYTYVPTNGRLESMRLFKCSSSGKLKHLEAHRKSSRPCSGGVVFASREYEAIGGQFSPGDILALVLQSGSPPLDVEIVEASIQDALNEKEVNLTDLFSPHRIGIRAIGRPLLGKTKPISLVGNETDKVVSSAEKPAVSCGSRLEFSEQAELKTSDWQMLISRAIEKAASVEAH